MDKTLKIGFNYKINMNNMRISDIPLPKYKVSGIY